MEYVLYHSGIKGMKWGVRRYQNKDGSLTPAGIKRYARKGFAEDSYNSNKTKVGKAWDKVTNAHKYGGDAMYGVSSEKERKARAEKYVADQKAKKEAKAKEREAARKDAGSYESRMGKAAKANRAIYTVEAVRAASRGDILKTAIYGRQADQYRKYGESLKETSPNKENCSKTAKNGATKVAKTVANIGAAYMADQVFNKGLGTKIVKETVKQTGRAVVTAYIMARGGYDIRWYDN